MEENVSGVFLNHNGLQAKGRNNEMITAIKKIRQYVAVSGAGVDPVLNKLIERILEIREMLSDQLAEVENR